MMTALGASHMATLPQTLSVDAAAKRRLIFAPMRPECFSVDGSVECRTITQLRMASHVPWRRPIRYIKSPCELCGESIDGGFVEWSAMFHPRRGHVKVCSYGLGCWCLGHWVTPMAGEAGPGSVTAGWGLRSDALLLGRWLLPVLTIGVSECILANYMLARLERLNLVDIVVVWL